MANPFEVAWEWARKRRDSRDTQEIDRITAGWNQPTPSENRQAPEPLRYRLIQAFWAFVESTVPRTPEQVAGQPAYVPRHAVRDTWTARQASTVNTQTGAWPVVARG